MSKLTGRNIYGLQIKCNYDINKDYTIHDLDFTDMYNKTFCSERFRICMRSHNISDNIVIMDDKDGNELFHIFKLKDGIYTHNTVLSIRKDLVKFDQMLEDIFYNNDYVFFLKENLTICKSSLVFDTLTYPNKAKAYDELISKLSFQFNIVS